MPDGISYAECCKIHSNLGGKSDGCQEYTERLYYTEDCLVCGCHKKFHRKVVAVPPVKYKTEVVYTKCHKLHTYKFMDGCQEFNPKGEEGTADALTCALCGCHKGFHRNEITV